MTNIALRDCPFCGPQTADGKKVEMHETSVTGPDGYVLGYTVRCCLCGIEMHDEHENEMARRWNRRPADPVTTVRCSECGWTGESTELGPEGECGDGCHGSSVSEITDPAGMLKAWMDSEGHLCGPMLADAGLIAPQPAAVEEAEKLDLGPGATVWAITTAGYAILNAAKAGA